MKISGARAAEPSAGPEIAAAARSRPLDFALLFLLAAIWGASFMFIKVAVETIPPMTVAAGRLAFAAAILTAFALAGGQRIPVNLRAWGMFLFIGLFGNALPFTLIGWGEQRIDSGPAAILMGIMPVVVAVLAHFCVRDERLSARRAAGVALGFSGLVALVGVEALQGLGREVVSQLAVVSGAVCYSISTIFTRLFVRLPGRIMAAGATIAGTVLILPLALLRERPWELEPSAASVACVIALGVGATAVATLLYFRLIRILGATVFSQVNYLIPLMGVAWGVLLLGERPGAGALLALGLILAGVGLVSRRPRTTGEQGAGVAATKG